MNEKNNGLLWSFSPTAAQSHFKTRSSTAHFGAFPSLCNVVPQSGPRIRSDFPF